MTTVRAALYLDFDNVLSGLLKLDPEVAIRFAESPGDWLTRLSDELTVAAPRRWLVMRCYLNPDGSVAHPTRPGERLRFSRFRRHFVQAGFEIVDCPRLGYTKNAADIRMVMDALDAIGSPAAYQEFVIASGDSDLTPLLVRLRAEGRRTTVVSASEAVEAFVAVPDRVIGGDQLLALVQGEQIEQDDQEQASTMQDDVDPEAGGEALAVATVRAMYDAATEPIFMSNVAQAVRRRVLEGPGGDVDTWFGHSAFKKFLTSLELPHAATSQYYLWDQLRHVPPAEAIGDGDGDGPTVIVRLTSLLKIPALESSHWKAIHRALEEYARRGEPFNLSECARWVRDRLAEGEFAVPRSAVQLVIKGASYGGCPIYGDPPPTAQQIGTAFAENALDRAEAAGVSFEPEEAVEIRAWFGPPGDDKASQD